MSQYQVSCKILLKGQSNTGKTSLKESLMMHPFDSSYNPTIGVDVAIVITTLNHLKIKVQLLDLSGLERFRTINLMHFRGTHGVIIMYDITSRQSFLELGKWVKEAREKCNDAKIVIVGNKVDLGDKREVSEDEGRRYAREIGANFIEVSAKSGKNVKEAFDALLFDINREQVEKAEKKAQQEEQERVNKANQQARKVDFNLLPLAWKVGGGLCALGAVGIGAYLYRKYQK